MKSLKHYIVESVRTYDYRLQIAGEIDPNKLDLLRYNLQKFSPVSISQPKSTPIQKTPTNFPGIENQPVTTVNIECRYPVTEPMIKQLGQLLGIDENRIRLFGSQYANSIDKENEQYQNQMKESPLLTKEEMADNGKEANKAYSNSYLDSIKEQTKDSKIDIPYEGKKTPNSFDPFKIIPQDSMGAKSPMSTIKRPPKPKTGAMA